jgi:hypothetical protein
LLKKAQALVVIKFIKTFAMNFVTPKAAAKLELWFNKLLRNQSSNFAKALGFQIHTNHLHEFGLTQSCS